MLVDTNTFKANVNQLHYMWLSWELLVLLSIKYLKVIFDKEVMSLNCKIFLGHVLFWDYENENSSSVLEIIDI